MKDYEVLHTVFISMYIIIILMTFAYEVKK